MQSYLTDLMSSLFEMGPPLLVKVLLTLAFDVARRAWRRSRVSPASAAKPGSQCRARSHQPDSKSQT